MTVTVHVRLVVQVANGDLTNSQVYRDLPGSQSMKLAGVRSGKTNSVSLSSTSNKV